jgi:hypothetical protein
MWTQVDSGQLNSDSAPACPSRNLAEQIATPTSHVDDLHGIA